MKIFQIIISAIIVFCINACFFSKEDPLEKERKEFNKWLEENTPLAFYKGIKVSVRSLPLEQNYSDIDSIMENDSQNEIPKHTLYLIKKILEVGQNAGEISILEGIQMMKALNDLKGELKNSDEDSYPTILEVLLYVSENYGNYGDFLKLINWNNSKEHLVLCGLMTAAKPLPPSFQLYEASRLDVEQLEKTEIKPLGAILKGSSLMMNKWYYLSEESLSQGINSLDNDKLYFVYKNYPSLFKEAKVTSEEVQIIQLHALSCLMRGFVRSQIDDEDKNEQALDDFELFLADADKIGLDNELVWFAGAYVNITKEKPDEAIVYLEKFKQSELISDSEKEAIDEIIAYLNKREPDKALNTVYDKLFIGKLIFRHIAHYLKEIDWYKEMEKSETGRQFLRISEVVGEEYEKMESGFDSDKLKEKGKELLKDIF